MTQLAPTSRHLPAVPAGFALHEDETVSFGLRRLTLEEFDRAIGDLVSGGDLDRAVHEARKSMKRLRAVLRLVRPSLGDEVYRSENVRLRDAARLIAPVRDSAVIVGLIGRMRQRHISHLRRTAFEGLEQRLAAQHEAEVASLASGSALATVVYELRSARARYRVWPVEGSDRLGSPVPDAFGTLGPGLERIYRRGRKEMHVARNEPTAHNLHWWRKRVKYLRHQLEILEPIWPDMLDTHIASLDRLGEVLGEDHDLAELVRLITVEPGLCDDAAERSMVIALAEHRRRELQAAAFILGRRVYAERPSQFTSRIGAYWETAHELR